MFEGWGAGLAAAAVVGAAATKSGADSAASATRDAAATSAQTQADALAQQATLSKPYRDLGTNNIQTYQSLLTGQGPGSAPLSYDQWVAQQGSAPAGTTGTGADTAQGRILGGPGGPGMVRGPQAQLAVGKADTSRAAYDQYVKNFKPTSSGANIQQTLESLPGYQFTRDQGIEAAKRAAGAGGLNLSGNQIAGVETYASGLADQTYSQRLAELLQPIQIGQAAAAGQAANVGNAANINSANQINAGNTLAGIDANTAASYAKIAGNTINSYQTQSYLNSLNNPSSTGTGTTPAAPPTYQPPDWSNAGLPAQAPG